MGTPGAGKSTQIAILASEFRASGFKIRTTDLSSGYVWDYLRPLAIILAKLLTRRSNASPTSALAEGDPKVYRTLLKLWLMLDTFDIYAKFLLDIYVPSRLGYSLIIEQSIPNKIAEYFYFCRLLGLSSDEASPWTSLVQRLTHFIQPARAVFLDAETKVLQSRWRARTAGRAGRARARRARNEVNIAETLEYLYMQRTVALSLAKAYHQELVCVDSTYGEDLTYRQVRGAISDLFSDQQT
jgi:thymidylate kinase